MTISKLDYCQYLLLTQINYTLTNFADHAQWFALDPLMHEKCVPKDGRSSSFTEN